MEGEPVSLTLLGVFFIARGFVTWLSRKLEVPTGSLRVSVGMDSRISGFAVRCSAMAAKKTINVLFGKTGHTSASRIRNHKCS